MISEYLLIASVGLPFLGAIISYIVGKFSKALRNGFVIGLTLAELAIMIVLVANRITFSEPLYVRVDEICGFGLSFSLDGFRMIYGLIAGFMWAMTAMFSEDYFAHYRNRNRYYVFFLLTLGATVGVFFSANLLTTFIFFEIMSFTSYVWVAQDEREESLKAAQTYLAVAVIGGMVLLMGLFLLYHCLGTLEMRELPAACEACEEKALLWIAGICSFVGFGAKAGAFPLHIWLPKAHPVAPAPASALLSGILTKSGIFGLLVVTTNIFFENASWGSFILIMGTVTMVGGAVLALFSVDLKRTLACSSMSQLGFILVGMGILSMPFGEGVLAMQGTLLHMVNHSLIKLILFMAAGVVYKNLHELDLNAIRGFGKKKPFLHVVFLLGTYGLMCLPFGNGYASKTLLHEGIVEWIEKVEEEPEILGAIAPVFRGLFASAGSFRILEWLFLFSGGCTIGYMLKLYVCLFLEENRSKEKQSKMDAMKKYLKPMSYVALGASALAIPVLGIMPGVVMDAIAQLGLSFFRPMEEMERIHYFSGSNLKGTVISLTIGLILYFGIVRNFLMTKDKQGTEYVDRWPKWLDLESLIYRPAILTVLKNFGILVASVPDTLVDLTVLLLRKTIYRDRKLPHERLEGSTFTDALGDFLDRHRRDDRIPMRHRLAVWNHEADEFYTLLRRTMSFGLILFCMGLVCTLIYLLVLL